jgi:Predicted O-methyltransferase
MVDNVLWRGDVVDPMMTDSDTRAIKKFNEFVATDSRVSLSMIPVGDGLTLAVVL